VLQIEESPTRRRNGEALKKMVLRQPGKRNPGKKRNPEADL